LSALASSRLYRALLLTTCGLLGAPLVLAQPVARPAASSPDDILARVRASASIAQASCHGRIHHDTYEYEHCLLDLLAPLKRATPERLGIEYFGYVGAMNSLRMSMQGAEASAYEFLHRMRRTQQQLRLSDDALCSTVPGDCQVRLATQRLMLAAPAKRQHPRRDPSEEHQHVH
jgi:hypothetical protein